MPSEDILPIILMNYGQVKFQEAQTWFEESEEALGQNDSPSLVDVGAGFGPAAPLRKLGLTRPGPNDV